MLIGPCYLKAPISNQICRVDVRVERCAQRQSTPLASDSNLMVARIAH